MNSCDDMRMALRGFGEREIDMRLMSEGDEAYVTWVVVCNGLPELFRHLKPVATRGPISVVTASHSAIVLQDEVLIRGLIPHLGDLELLEAFRCSCGSEDTSMVSTMLPNPPAHIQAEATISCLQHAVTAGRFDLLQLLITGGADLNKTITEDGLNHKTGTCLHWLASCGLGTSVRRRAPLPMIKIFCDSGADLDEKDDNRQTVLHYFAISGARNVTTLLGLDDFTTDGIAWIYEAVLQKHIDSGADINVQNTSGKTPLHLAAIDDEEMMVKILLKASVIAVIKDRDGTSANKLSTLSMKHMVRRYEKDQQSKLEENKELEAARRVETAKGVEAAEQRKLIEEWENTF